MEIKKLTCIGCPLGCQISVALDRGQVAEINGNTCKRGKVYAEKEVTNPTRIVTSTVRVTGGERPVVSVKTGRDIPKKDIRRCMLALKELEVEAPVYSGQVLLNDIAGTGAKLIATATVKEDPDLSENGKIT